MAVLIWMWPTRLSDGIYPQIKSPGSLIRLTVFIWNYGIYQIFDALVCIDEFFASVYLYIFYNYFDCLPFNQIKLCLLLNKL